MNRIYDIHTVLLADREAGSARSPSHRLGSGSVLFVDSVVSILAG